MDGICENDHVKPFRFAGNHFHTVLKIPSCSPFKCACFPIKMALTFEFVAELQMFEKCKLGAFYTPLFCDVSHYAGNDNGAKLTALEGEDG